MARSVSLRKPKPLRRMYYGIKAKKRGGVDPVAMGDQVFGE